MEDGGAAEGDDEGVDVAIAPGGVGVRLELGGGRRGHVDGGGDVTAEARRGSEACSPERDAHVALGVDVGESGAGDVVCFGRR